MIIYEINYGLGVFGPEMAMDFGSTKWNQCLVSGLPTDSPLLILGLLKTVPVSWLDRNWSMCVSSKILLELDSLNCVKKKKKLLMHIIKCVNMMMNYIKK